MELKQDVEYEENDTRPLLIVPYGIETRMNVQHVALQILLIVPYGIETSVFTP